MDKKIILAGLFVFGTSLPAMAEDWPSGDLMKAGKTYTGAATSEHMGVTSGSVTANAWYTIKPGFYLPQGTATAAACRAGNYCAGGDYAISDSADQGETPCAKGSYSSASASQCTACISPYTTEGTGATSSAACKKDINLYVYGTTTGTLTTTGGTIAAGSSSEWKKLVCTQGQSCILPDASVLTADGLTFTGGWYTGQPSSDPSTSCPVAAGTAIAADSTTQHFACWLPTSFTLPLIVLNNASEGTGGTLTKGTQQIYYYYYTNPSSTTTTTEVRELYSGCSNGTENCAPNSLTNKITAGYKITPPSWPGHEFKGYYTQTGGNGDQLIESDGTIASVGADFLSKLSKPTSINTSDHMLYAWWSADVNCPAGTFFMKAYSDCLTCSMGHYCPGGEFTENSQGDMPGLLECPANTYSDAQGLSECKACSTGYRVSAGANTVKSACKKTIALNKNGGTGTINSATETTNATASCAEGESCTLPDTSTLTEPGYSFTDSNNTSRGWGTQGCVSGKRIFSDAEIKAAGTFYACKMGAGIEIVWLGVNGGSGNEKSSVTSVQYGGDIVTPAAAANSNTSGQKFLGWKFVKPAN